MLSSLRTVYICEDIHSHIFMSEYLIYSDLKVLENWCKPKVSNSNSDLKRMLKQYKNYFIWTSSWLFRKNYGLSISEVPIFPWFSYVYFFVQCSKEITFGSKFKNLHNLLLMNLLSLCIDLQIFLSDLIIDEKVLSL